MTKKHFANDDASILTEQAVSVNPPVVLDVSLPGVSSPLDGTVTWEASLNPAVEWLQVDMFSETSSHAAHPNR